MKRFILSFLFCFMLTIPAYEIANAQCAACKETAESSLKEGNTQAAGLNMGIMYLLIIPYVLVGAIGYYWYANNKKKEQSPSEE